VISTSGDSAFRFLLEVAVGGGGFDEAGIGESALYLIWKH